MTYEIKDMQNVQLEIFKEVYKISKNNDIPIFLAYGTALGAVRHGGFIPWDDDIDLFIFYEDRERFKAACEKELPENLFYQSVETDKGYRLAIDRIRNSDTTLIEEDEKDNDINHGIFIDIYPLYKCAETKTGHMVQRISRLLYRLFLYNEKPKNKGRLTTIMAYIVLKLTPGFIKKSIMERNADFVQNKGEEKYVSTFYWDESIKYNRAWFKKIKEVDFEDTKAPLAEGTTAFLEMRYGDYMQLPPEEKRTVHHNYVRVDCKKSYKEK